jgi:GNAT superfamily N-acetyltransferase
MIEIKEVSTKKEQKEFLNFPLDLYKGNPYYIPPMYMDEKKIFRKDYVYNTSCDSVFYNAYEDGKIVGRIQGIIQRDANAKNGEKRARFTRLEALDNPAIFKALMEAVESWARCKGMDTIHGPIGYSDLEKEGLLIEGFEVPGNFETTYNHPYYQKHVEALGYNKEVDYTGSFLYGPESEETLQEMQQLVDFIFKRYKLHFGESRNGADFMRKYADGIFDLMDKSYEGLYGTVPFTDGMRKLMLDNFGLVINPKYSAIILDQNNKPVCFGLAIPSLNKAFRGTRGHITPGVAIRFLQCTRHPESLDMCIIGVDPEYLNRGVSSALSLAVMKMLKESPTLRYADTCINLEDNYAIQNQWKRFRRDTPKRYRAYVKSL